MTAEEAEAVAKGLAEFVVRHHMRRDDSPQRGVAYESFCVDKAETHQQWIQSERLDTMHDGAWFGVALAHAAAVTGDRWYREVLICDLLSICSKMRNPSDELFDPSRNDSDRPVPPLGRDSCSGQKERRGLCRSWWENRASGSKDMLNRLDGLRRLVFPGRDERKVTDDQEYRLSGYSLGMSKSRCVLAGHLGAP